MEPAEEIEQAKQRIITLEKQLALWQKGALDTLTPEQLAMSLFKQQVETLTFHLLKEKQRNQELVKQIGENSDHFNQAEVEYKNQIAELTKNLESAVSNIEYLESEIYKKSSELKRAEHLIKTNPKKAPLRKIDMGRGQRVGMASIMGEGEVSDFLHGPRNKKGFGESTEKKAKSIRDLLNLMTTIDKIKLLDASILLEINPDTVISWAKRLESKKYVVLQGSNRDKMMIYSTDKLRGIR